MTQEMTKERLEYIKEVHHHSCEFYGFYDCIGCELIREIERLWKELKQKK